MKKAISLIVLLSGCSLSLPPIIKQEESAPLQNAQLKAAQLRCIEALNSDRNDAEHQRDLSDTLVVTGAAIASVSGASTGVLAALIPTNGTDDHGAKAGAVVTGVLTVVGAIIAVASKIAESPAVPLVRRKSAEHSYNLALKALAQKDEVSALSNFVDCYTFSADGTTPQMTAHSL